VGRLDNIIARNRRPDGSRERLAMLVGFVILVLVVVILMMFTDLGMPPTPERGKRVEGIFLGTPAKPASH
jgi:hypothetical protein